MAVALVFLQLNRYEVVECAPEVCTVADRLTGEIGYRVTGPALARMARQDSTFDADAFVRDIAP